MATNKKKLLITQSMAPGGLGAAVKSGRTSRPCKFPNTITTPDFQALLEQHAPVNGVALGVTTFALPR